MVIQTRLYLLLLQWSRQTTRTYTLRRRLPSRRTFSRSGTRIAYHRPTSIERSFFALMAQVRSALVFQIRCLGANAYLSGDQFDDDVNSHFFPARLSSLFWSILEFKYCQFCFSLEEEWQFKATRLLSGTYTTRYIYSKYVWSQHTAHLQAGIGTYTTPQVAGPMMAKVHKALDAMIGVHLNAHVMSKQDSILCGAQTESRDRWLRIPHAKLWAVMMMSKNWQIQYAQMSMVIRYPSLVCFSVLCARHFFLTSSYWRQGFHEEHVSGVRSRKDS